MKSSMKNLSLEEFAQIDSDICVILRKENAEYSRLLDQMIELMAAYPALLQLLDQDQAVALTCQEAEAFQSYRKLEREAEDMERYALYLQGYRNGLTDA